MEAEAATAVEAARGFFLCGKERRSVAGLVCGGLGPSGRWFGSKKHET